MERHYGAVDIDRRGERIGTRLLDDAAAFCGVALGAGRGAVGRGGRNEASFGVAEEYGEVRTRVAVGAERLCQDETIG